MVSSGVSCDSACRHPPFRVVATTYQHPLVRTRAMHGLWLTHPRRNASGGVPPAPVVVVAPWVPILLRESLLYVCFEEVLPDFLDRCFSGFVFLDVDLKVCWP